MDVLSLLDLLTDELNRSSQIPLSGGKAAVDRLRLLDMVEQIRDALPEDIRAAEETRRERQRILMEAGREAETIVEDARTQAKQILSEHEIIKQATTDAQAMMQKAQEQSRQMRVAANDYANELLGNVENFMTGHMELLKQNRLALKKMIR